MHGKTTFYNLYNTVSSARSDSATECSHRIAIPRAAISHTENGVEAKCSLCKKRHTFLLYKTTPVSTPGEEKRFMEWAENNNIEIFKLAK
jgi:hypothetical protein